MPRRSRPRVATARIVAARFAALAVAVVLVAACRDTGGASQGPQQSPPTPLVSLKVGLGYIPSVQFAPFYYAEQKGYYAAAGLEVTFENKIDPDLITLVGQGAIDLGVADGTSVIPAVSQGIPIRYVATIYGSYPSIVFAKATSGIKTAADLAGRKLGIPGKYGSSWIMLQALLASAGLSPDDLTIVEYPDFGQGVAVQQGAVDAATGFANNEPVVLERSGSEVVVLHVDDVIALPGPGLIAGVKALGEQRDAVSRFVSATLRAMHDIAAEPELGLNAAIAKVPELGSDRAQQLAILEATIAAWAPPGRRPTDLGRIDPAGWAASIEYLETLGLVPNPVKVEDAVDTTLGVAPGNA